jgi:hypothetical protein
MSLEDRMVEQMTLSQLKAELKEKEKGCGKEFYGKLVLKYFCGSVHLCPTCQAVIETYKKGISACEEILNSQQNKSNLGCDDIETYQAVFKEGYKQALSQRNKEILEIIDKEIRFWKTANCGEERKRTSLMLLQELKQQFTNSEKEIKQALSNRNKEILEIIDKWVQDVNDTEIILEIKQLTTTEEGKE